MKSGKAGWRQKREFMPESGNVDTYEIGRVENFTTQQSISSQISISSDFRRFRALQL